MRSTLWMLCLVLSLGLVVASSSVFAEELTFPTTEEEILKALDKSPNLGPGALGGGSGDDGSLFGKKKKSNTRGLGAIADDEEVLERAPKVGALILFDTNSAKIKAESLPLLQNYGRVLEGALKDAVLIVAGHTDDKGADKYNFKLSQKRAEAVRDFLVAEFNIGESRLMVKPYGETKPIEDNTTSDGRAKNRRVEFIRVQ